MGQTFISPVQHDIPENVQRLLNEIAAMPLWEYLILRQEIDGLVDRYLPVERIVRG